MATKKEIFRPLILLALSILAIFLLMLLTSPVNKIGYVIVFYLLLLASLFSLGYLVVRIWGAETNAKNRYRVSVISIFIVVSLMFVSAQSFSWVDGLIVLLVAFGLLFYGSRRF